MIKETKKVRKTLCNSKYILKSSIRCYVINMKLLKLQINAANRKKNTKVVTTPSLIIFLLLQPSWMLHSMNLQYILSKSFFIETKLGWCIKFAITTLRATAKCKLIIFVNTDVVQGFKFVSCYYPYNPKLWFKIISIVHCWHSGSRATVIQLNTRAPPQCKQVWLRVIPLMDQNTIFFVMPCDPKQALMDKSQIRANRILVISKALGLWDQVTIHPYLQLLADRLTATG